jgi:hypothetical protein
VLVLSGVLFTDHIAEPHLGLWLTFLDEVELLSSSSYTPTEVDAVYRATHKFNELLSSRTPAVPSSQSLTRSHIAGGRIV